LAFPIRPFVGIVCCYGRISLPSGLCLPAFPVPPPDITRPCFEVWRGALKFTKVVVFVVPKELSFSWFRFSLWDDPHGNSSPAAAIIYGDITDITQI